MPKYDKKNPCQLKIKERICLSGPESTKQTYHISLDLKGTDFTFNPGDSVGIFPDNPSDEVEEILARIPNVSITHPITKANISLETFLLKNANLDRITTPLLRAAAPHYLENAEAKLKAQASHSVSTLIAKYPNLDSQTLADSLAPLLPRFYSIASSLNRFADELHLLVAEINYNKGPHTKKGVTSEFLCHTATEQTPIPTFLLPNTKFTLPDPNTPIIMIGPGTGIAPYRAFLHEREKHPTRNWLFFGERHSKTDFTYKDYLQELQNQNKLLLSTAFSRDTSNKIYVQHRMLENQKELWQWIQDGAKIYVCGDKKRMAKDVNQTLIDIAQNHGADGPDFIKNLRKEGRYLLDVY